MKWEYPQNRINRRPPVSAGDTSWKLVKQSLYFFAHFTIPLMKGVGQK
nr:MAG TPA: hypothetical protein [Caudoviricetes sp.]